MPPLTQPVVGVDDALSYLTTIQTTFQDRPQVYAEFLQIMKDFKDHVADTSDTMERVSKLFAGHPALIQGFNVFLPPGYEIQQVF